MAEMGVANVPSDEMEAEYDFEDKVGVDKDLSGDGGVVKTIERSGEGWETPEKGDDVTVHYVGTLLDGTKFDSSRDRGEPFNFKLGVGNVIKGWDVGVASMRKGEVAKLTCKPEYAYGAAGSPPTIPPDATLVFEVELLSWRNVKDVTGDGGVIKTVLTEGQGWATPKPEDEVVLTYSARLTDPPAAAAAAGKPGQKPATAAEQGLPVVASSPEQGAVFTVADAPCSGVAAALKSMKVHEAVRLLLKPEYAAGLVDVPEGKLLEVEATLAELHAVTHPGPGVTKKSLVKPDSYMRPNEGSTVNLAVEVRGLDGAVLEASHEVEMVLDEEQAPEGLEMSLLQMNEGERALITISTTLPDGSRDPSLLAAPDGALVGASVPADAAGAVFDVTLQSFTKSKEKWEMNNQEKLAAALQRKEKGNAAYKAGRVSRAVRQYTAAYETANSINERDLAPHPVTEGGEEGSSPEAIKRQAKEVKKASSLNLAAAALKQQNWSEAVKQASRVLELDPGNVKALYRRAQARMALSDLLEAELDIKAGLLNHPDNTDLAALLRKLKVQARAANKKDAKLYGKMFAALGRAGHTDQGAEATGETADAPTAAADAPTPMQADPATSVVEAAA